VALKDDIALGTLLPHRSPDPHDIDEVRWVAQRAEALGFGDLWVTENSLDHAYSIDAIVALTYAAAVTTRIRVGTAVIVMPTHHPIHIAHQAASLDFASKGRLILGVGLGRDQEYHDFQVPVERRVRRFREAIEIMKALWTQDRVNYDGDIYKLHDAGIAQKPVQKPHPPLWMGGWHPNALKRAAQMADGWMGAGAQTNEDFARCVKILKTELAKAGRDPGKFPISKRVLMAVGDDEQAARAQLNNWITRVYHNPTLVDTGGVYGRPAKVREQLEQLKALGVNHLLLNFVSHYREQLEAAAEVAGLK
jgi:probable F420-dependent oxidoreductase